MVEMFQGQQGC